MEVIPVYVVLPPRLLLLDVAGPLEVLRRANYLQGKVRFDFRYVGPSPSLRTSIGMSVNGVGPLPRALPPGAMVVLGGDVDEVACFRTSNAPPRERLDATLQGKIVDWLRRVIGPQHELVTICSGALLAARAGLLDHYRCTTHYSCCSELAELAPTARVLDSRLHVHDGNRYSSAGITAGVDLMLYIVGKRVDEACAVAVARYMVVYLRRAGADPQLSPWLEGRNHIHPKVHRVQDAMSRDPAAAWSLVRLATIAGASGRHLSRVFREQTGMSIADYRSGLRVAVARELLSQTRLSIEAVAERAGFGSSRQLRRAWRRVYETTPRQIRAR